MPLPTLVKTWEFVNGSAASLVNQAFTTSGVVLTDARVILLALVNSFLNFATHPHTCVGSSDGAGSSNMSGSNLWTGVTKLVWNSAGSNHSWIVLKNQIGTNTYSYCFDLNNVTSSNISIIVSPGAGFTGGSATARPTATDEQVLVNGSAWMSGAVNAVLHVWHSTDDLVINAVLFQAGSPQLGIVMSVPANPSAGWTKPSISYAQGGASSVFLAASIYGSAAAKGFMASSSSFFFTAEAVNNSTISATQTYANDITGEWPFGAIGLYSTTASNRGRHGSLIDMWWGTSIAGNGDNYPLDGSKQFVQFGTLIFPWNGTTPLVA